MISTKFKIMLKIKSDIHVNAQVHINSTNNSIVPLPPIQTTQAHIYTIEDFQAASQKLHSQDKNKI